MSRKSNPVCWFEIPCTEIGRAVEFYESTFETKLTLRETGTLRMAWFPVHDEAVGTSGGLVAGPGYQPSLVGTVVYFSTPDLDYTLNRALAAGGKVVQARTGIGQYGSIAVFQDSEGNRVGLHQAQARPTP